MTKSKSGAMEKERQLDTEWQQIHDEFLTAAKLDGLSRQDRKIEAILFVGSLQAIPNEVGGTQKRDHESAKIRARANAKFATDLRRLVNASKTLTYLNVIELSGEDAKKARRIERFIKLILDPDGISKDVANVTKVRLESRSHRAAIAVLQVFAEHGIKTPDTRNSYVERCTKLVLSKFHGPTDVSDHRELLRRARKSITTTRSPA